MVANEEKKRYGKGKTIIIFGVLLVLLIFLYNYNASISYYGTIEIRELKHDNDEYIVVVEGDFGVKESSFKERDSFTIRENEESREGNITDIWDYLLEGKSFHVLLEAYENRDEFSLERIYLD